MDVSARLSRLAAVMRQQRLPALLVTHLPDVRWLCGFTGSSAAVVVHASASRLALRLFTDGRYTAQAQAEVQGARVRIAKKSALAEALNFAARSTAARCGYDAATTTVATLQMLRKHLSSEADGTSGSRGHMRRSPSFLHGTEGLVAGLRQVKNDKEIAMLRRAAQAGCELYEGMLGFIEAGMREIDVAAELEHRARLAGAEAMSFETIVASGVRSSMPHARATGAKLEAGTLLTLDFGIMLDGYCSDMTRTIFLGGSGVSPKRKRAEAEQRAVFDAVLAAQEAAVSAVRAGVKAGAVDLAARRVLKQAGWAKHFTHSTGHGLGLEIHEGPRIAAKQEALLEAGMVVTIEPGVYLPGAYGVRIEDTVLVTDTGCEVLTPVHKGWIEL